MWCSVGAVRASIGVRHLEPAAAKKRQWPSLRVGWPSDGTCVDEDEPNAACRVLERQSWT